MDSLRKRAKELLESKAVQIVVGYEKGTGANIRPAFITDPAKTDKLIYNEHCVHNLAGYLLKHEVKHRGKIALVATIPVMRTVILLYTEKQITDAEVILLGISDDGKLLDFPTLTIVESYLQKAPIDHPAKDKVMLEKLSKMSLQERWDFWQEQLSKCVKCYACRQTCPLCYCTRCTVECNQPQWIPVPSHSIGNVEWHLMRAMHLAGRCISCGECGRACPLDIPCHLLTMHLADETIKNFGVKSGISLKQDSVLSTYQPNDKESFIL
jgi:ferredoxin